MSYLYPTLSYTDVESAGTRAACHATSLSLIHLFSSLLLLSFLFFSFLFFYHFINIISQDTTEAAAAAQLTADSALDSLNSITIPFQTEKVSTKSPFLILFF